MICFGLELFSDNQEVIVQILDAIKKLIAIEDQIDYSLNDSSYTSIIINNCDIKSKLDLLQRNQNEKIADYADELYDYIFKDNQNDINI